jgi:hypothetical protein
MPSLKDMVMEMLAGRGRDPGQVDIDFDQLGVNEGATVAAPREGMWKESSYDLLTGLEVSEKPMDTMPNELIDVFFKH